jgi:hypothetical protein
LIQTRPTNEGTSLERRRAVQKIIALVLVTTAVCGIVFEPIDKGSVMFSITHKHGVDTGDLPFVVLLVVAAWLARPE